MVVAVAMSGVVMDGDGDSCGGGGGERWLR